MSPVWKILRAVVSEEGETSMAINLDGVEINLDGEDEEDFDYDGNSTNATENEDEKCYRPIDIDQADFYRYVTIPAVILIITLHLLKQLRSKQEHGGFCGKPVVIWPVNLLGQRSHRFPYVAAFNIAAWALCDLIIGSDNPLSIQTDIAALKTLMKLLTCLVLAIIFYPIFACISSRDLIGYILGMAYTWMFTLLYVMINYPSPCVGEDVRGEIYDGFQFIPCLFWSLYLCAYFPHRIFNIVFKRADHTHGEGKLSFHREYVRRLVNIPDKPPVPFKESYGREGGVMQKLTKRLFAKVYAPVEGFRYPISMLTATSVSMTLVWTIATDILQVYEVGVINGKRIVLQVFGPKVAQLANSTMVRKSMAESTSYQKALIWWRSMTYAMYISFALAFIATVITLLLSLRNYRTHMFQFYKGQVPDLPRTKNRPPRVIVVAGSKYVGFQFGYALWGFIAKTITLLIICAAITYFVVSIVIFKDSALLLKILAWVGPLLGYLYGIMIIQQLLVHFFFLQKDEKGKRVLAINRLHAFFNFQYFMVFINSAVGLVTSLLRVLKTAIFAAFTLGRLDMSTMSRCFEGKDNGFQAYINLLELENVQTHPIVWTFIELLKEEAMKSRSSQNGGTLSVEMKGDKVQESHQNPKSIDSAHRHKVIRNRWRMAMTLVNSSFLRHYRKQEMRALSNSEGAFAAAEQRVKMDKVDMIKQKAASVFTNGFKIARRTESTKEDKEKV